MCKIRTLLKVSYMTHISLLFVWASDLQAALSSAFKYKSCFTNLNHNSTPDLVKAVT